MGYKITIKLKSDGVSLEPSGFENDQFTTDIYGYNPVDKKCCKIAPHWDKVGDKMIIGYIPFVLSSEYSNMTDNTTYGYIINPMKSIDNVILTNKTKDQTFEIYKELCKFLSNNIEKFKL